MAHWKTGPNGTVKMMDTLIEGYFKENGVRERLISCANALVKQRRLRAVDEEKWEKYAMHSDWNYIGD